MAFFQRSQRNVAPAHLRRLPRSVALLALILVLAAVVLTLTLRQPPVWTLDVGAAGDARYSADFFAVERGEGATFRWSGPDSALLLHGADLVPAILQLRLHADQRALENDQRLTLTRDDQPLAAFKLGAGWRTYHTLLRAGVGGETPRIGLVTSANQGKPVRGRVLGVAVDQVRVVPLGTAALVGPLVRALLLTWALALLATVLWQTLRSKWLASFFRSAISSPQSPVPNRQSPLVLQTLIVAVVGAAATLLIGWAQRDPYALARAFPPMPWLLGLATLALVIRGQGTGDRGQGTEAGRSPAHLLTRSPAHIVIVSMAVLAVAQALLTTQMAVALGVALALAALVYVGGLGASPADARPDLSPRAAALILAGVLVVALGLRFYRLGDLPYGLWRDEARHGELALRILEDPTYRPIYIASDRVNMPALGLYPFALAIKLWGIHPWSMRVVTALAGALTVLPIYGLVERLFARRDLALLAAVLLAVSSWHITISRFSFPTIFDPLFALTGLWLLMCGGGIRAAGGVATPAARIPHPQSSYSQPTYVLIICWFLAGVSFALALQTYHTGRVVPVVGAVLALLLLWRGGWQWRHWLVGAAAALLGFALVAAPLVSYALHNPSSFNDRTSAVFLLSEAALRGQAPLSALEDSVGRHLLMFNVRGDENGRHHAPGAPMLDYVTGLGFLLGCAALLRRWRDWRSIFVLAALALSVLPSLLSVDSPHAMRSIGDAAFACIIAAVGWVELWAVLRRGSGVRRQTLVQRRAASPLHLAIIALLALALNYRTYFVQMPSNPEVWQAAYPVHTQAGAYLRNLADTSGNDALPQIFVRANIVSNPVFEYLTHNLAVQTLSDKTPVAAARPGALFIISGYSAAHDAAKLPPYVGSIQQPFARGPLFPDGKTPSFVVYRRVP